MATSTDLRLPYFDHAFDLLATRGYGGLKLAPLCAAVGVTTGAFYHSFPSWKAFTSELLQHWHHERTTRLVELAKSEPSAAEQLEVLLGASVDLPHHAEAAIRVWAAIDPEVAALQASVDRERYAVILDAFRELVQNPGTADKFAKLGLYLLIGYEQSNAQQDLSALEWSLRLALTTARDHTS